MTTIFSKIIAREIPANIIYEDDTVLAFLDINPINPGHVLIIPKTESLDGTETDPTTLGHMMIIAQKIAKVQKKILNATGVNYIMNNGADAGQEVFHTHLHVVPRHKDDYRFKPVSKDAYPEGEAENVAQKLSSALS